MPLVSVILPVFNAEKYLVECLNSILAQSLTDFELLIYNDGSTDESDIIIKSYDDKRIRYVSMAENKGYLGLLNRGLKEAKGRFIARMDADDIAVPDRFKEQVQFLENNPEIGICGSWVEYFDGKSGIEKRPESSKAIQYALFFGCPITHPSAMMRTSMIRQFDLNYDSKYYYAEDHNFFVKASRCFQLANIPKPLLKYRVHQKQISSERWMEQFRIKALIQADLLVALVSPGSQEAVWLTQFMAEEMKPGRVWENEFKAVQKKLIDLNAVQKLYDPEIFESAVKVLFNQKRRGNIQAYFQRHYYNNKHFGWSLLFSFLLEHYNPIHFLGAKYSFYFVVKCFIRHKKPVIA